MDEEAFGRVVTVGCLNFKFGLELLTQPGMQGTYGILSFNQVDYL